MSSSSATLCCAVKGTVVLAMGCGCGYRVVMRGGGAGNVVAVIRVLVAAAVVVVLFVEEEKGGFVVEWVEVSGVWTLLLMLRTVDLLTHAAYAASIALAFVPVVFALIAFPLIPPLALLFS